ncbi:MAG: molecular chaperone TorD family protein [Acidobacteria bacterium]|nr:molecular chaperone TorD family protein [Acidobacteriota bacterium]
MSRNSSSGAKLIRSVGSTAAGGFAEEASRVFGTLALALLSDPTEDSLSALRDCNSTPIPGRFGHAMTELARAAASTELLVARVEYTRLFHHPQGATCPPWECVARDRAPHLMGPRHLDVVGFFRRAGIEPRRGDSESADHIGLELAFLSLLASRIAAGDDQCALFDEFWSSHVAPWMPAFARRLASESRLDLYVASGRLLLEAVTMGARSRD